MNRLKATIWLGSRNHTRKYDFLLLSCHQSCTYSSLIFLGLIKKCIIGWSSSFSLGTLFYGPSPQLSEGQALSCHSNLVHYDNSTHLNLGGSVPLLYLDPVISISVREPSFGKVGPLPRPRQQGWSHLSSPMTPFHQHISQQFENGLSSGLFHGTDFTGGFPSLTYIPSSVSTFLGHIPWAFFHSGAGTPTTLSLGSHFLQASKRHPIAGQHQISGPLLGCQILDPRRIFLYQHILYPLYSFLSEPTPSGFSNIQTLPFPENTCW